MWPPRLWQRGEEAEEREGGELRGAEQSAEDDAPAEEVPSRRLEDDAEQTPRTRSSSLELDHTY